MFQPPVLQTPRPAPNVFHLILSSSAFIISPPLSFSRSPPFPGSISTLITTTPIPLLPRPFVPCATLKPSPTVQELKRRLQAAPKPPEFGLSISEDEAVTPEEEAIEDTIEMLEDAGGKCNVLDHGAMLNGRWELLYTSSTMARYAGGLSGLAKVLPGGECRRVWALVDVDEQEGQFSEEVGWKIGRLDGSLVVRVDGRVEVRERGRVMWSPEKLRVGAWAFDAQGWKSLRAFGIMDHTFLDGDLRIARGQTGGVWVFWRIEDGESLKRLRS